MARGPSNGIKLESVTRTSISFSWSTNGFDISNFKIYVLEGSTSTHMYLYDVEGVVSYDASTCTVVTDSDAVTTITGLKSGTAYEVGFDYYDYDIWDNICTSTLAVKLIDLDSLTGYNTKLLEKLDIKYPALSSFNNAKSTLDEISAKVDYLSLDESLIRIGN